MFTIDKLNQNDDILQYAISHDIIDIEKIRENMREEQRSHYLNMHHYSVFQDQKGLWRTTFPDSSKKNGRRTIAKKTKEAVEDAIVAYYQRSEKHSLNVSDYVTMDELYPIWMKSRLSEVQSVNTAKRNNQDWDRYYKGTPITKIPMCDLTTNYMRDWAHNMIDRYRFTKRQYYNMTVIIKKMFEYVAAENVCDNNWSKVKINTKKLARDSKKSNVTQIYFNDEKFKIVSYALQKFQQNNRNITALAIPLLFMTGMRIGEVVALKYTDLDDKNIHVVRSESRSYYYDDKTHKFHYGGTEVVDHAKTQAGERAIPYTDGAKHIIAMIKEASDKYGYYDDGYIFCPASSRIQSNTIDKTLYSYCDILGIPKKSAHKIRKTYISTIIQHGIDLDTVCRVSGHVDMKTTFESYLFCLDRPDETHDKFEEILDNDNDMIKGA